MWNEERVERLTSLFHQGMSASVIAENLGGFEHTKDKGRNAVIGKLHRLGLKSGQQIIRRLLETTKPLPPPAETDIPRVSFRDLDRRQHCGWVCVEAPKGELIASLDAPVYCGCKPVPGLSYCEHHARRAFNVTPNAMLGSTRPDASANLRKHARTALARADIKVDPRTLEEVEA